MMSNKRNSNLRPLLLVLLAVAVLLAGTASAGWFGKKSDDQARRMPKTKRFHDTPRQSYVRGELQLGALGQWKIGARTLQMAPKCLILGEDGADGELAAGETYVVQGTVIGDMVFATQVRRVAQDWKTPPSLKQEGTRTPSRSNPDVGTLKDAPM